MAYIKTQLDDGTYVLIRDIAVTSDWGEGTGVTEGDLYGMVETSAFSDTVKKTADRVTVEAEKVFDKMRQTLVGIGGKMNEAFRKMPGNPDEMKLTVSMGFSSEAKAWVVEGGSSLDFQVELTWKREDGKKEGQEQD